MQTYICTIKNTTSVDLYQAQMISLTAWRASIGHWYQVIIRFPRGQHIQLVPNWQRNDFQGKFTYLSVLLCLHILLVIGGIERNPGPVLRSQQAAAVNSGEEH